MFCGNDGGNCGYQTAAAGGGGQISLMTTLALPYSNGDFSITMTAFGGAGFAYQWYGRNQVGPAGSPGTILLSTANFSELRVVGTAPADFTMVPMSPWSAMHVNRVVLNNASARIYTIDGQAHSVLQVDAFIFDRSRNLRDMWIIDGSTIGSIPSYFIPPSMQQPGVPLLTQGSFVPSPRHILVGSVVSEVTTSDEFYCQFSCAQLGPLNCSGYTYSTSTWPSGMNVAFNGISEAVANCQLYFNITALQPFPYARSSLLRSALPGVSSS